MASILTSSVVADIRGKIGDEVYSRNGSGLYVRSLGTWVQPDTARQLSRRLFITDVAPAWSATLTEQQRDDWRSYAHQHPQPNRWGELCQTTGYLAFMRCNSYRFILDEDIHFLDAPTAPPLHPPEFSFTAEAVTDTITVALPPTNYDPTPQWLNVFLFVGKPTTTGRHFFNGPWRWKAHALNYPPWDRDPWTVASPWPITAGQRMWCYLVAQSFYGGELSRPGRAQYDVP